jgi:glycosyltransferase involved in cell wall biosynthesis
VSRPGDYEALAKNTLELARNPRKAEEMGANGRSFVEREASLDKIGAELLNALTAAGRK